MENKIVGHWYHIANQVNQRSKRKRAINNFLYCFVGTIIGLLTLDLFVFLLWLLSKQATPTNFYYFGWITNQVIKLFI